MKLPNQPRIRYAILAMLLFVGIGVTFFLNPQKSSAASTNVFMRFDRMQTGTATTGTICFNPTTVATEGKVVVTFPTGYTLGLAATFTVSTTNLAWPTGGTAWPSIATASSVASQAVTFTSGDLTVGTLYCFNWINSAAVTTNASANTYTGTVQSQTAGSSPIDTYTYATATITNDQIVVSATVPPSFAFALSANTDALGTLSTGSVTSSPTPRTATVNTNAKNGWMVWAKDLNTGLTSTSASATIPSTTPGSNSTLTAGTAGYNTGVTSSQTGGTGTITVATPFVGSASTGNGLNTSYQTVATSNGTANNGVLTLTNNVAISAITPAATDYSDTITVVGAGLF